MTHIESERLTLAAMIRLYCRGQRHSAAKRKAEGLCADCQALLDYAFGRLERCPFGEAKGPCSSCHIHCYCPEMRTRIRTVMRYAGPRMLLHHPLLTLRHYLK